MTAITIHRTRGVYPTPPNRTRSEFLLTLGNIGKACWDFFDRVDTDHSRNPSKKISNAASFTSKLLPSPPKEWVDRRASIMRDFKTVDVLKVLLKNKWQRFCHFTYLKRQHEVPVKLSFRFTRERILTRVIILSVIASMILLISGRTQGALGIHIPGTAIDLMRTPTEPTNWLSGTPKIKGSREAVLGAFNYATEAGYPFVATKAERDDLIADGSLVRLKGNYIRLVDVTEPYVLPVVSRFVNRLGEQYAAQGCGKLEVSGAFRNLEHQGTLVNGSSYSVHPTGMAIDLRRIVPENDEQTWCLNWLQNRLTTIEAERRIDVTAEDHPRHFHVVVVTHDYERWLKTLIPQLDPEVKALATALYFEAAFNESMDGYRAIGWAIRNRAHSEGFTNTIVEVVAEGSAGRTSGGCQFSFMCDGKAERIQTLCIKPDTLNKQYWLNKCDERWNVVVNIAKQILAEPEAKDPTNGAVLYYAASMDKAPYWARRRIETREKADGSKYHVTLEHGDLEPGTIKQIGSHIFGCRNNSDVCRV